MFCCLYLFCFLRGLGLCFILLNTTEWKRCGLFELSYLENYLTLSILVFLTHFFKVFIDRKMFCCAFHKKVLFQSYFIVLNGLSWIGLSKNDMCGGKSALFLFSILSLSLCLFWLLLKTHLVLI